MDNSNNDIATSFATFHHLSIIALCPDTDPVTTELAVLRIASLSEELAHQFADDSEEMNKKLWCDLLPIVEKSLEVQS